MTAGQREIASSASVDARVRRMMGALAYAKRIDSSVRSALT